MARRTALRASDLDRERVVERLRRATAEGRLLAEELEDRLAAAFRARTYGELDALVADLPGERARRPRRSRLAPLALALAVLLALAAIVALLLTGVAIGFVWIAGAWFFLGRRRGCRGYCGYRGRRLTLFP